MWQELSYSAGLSFDYVQDEKIEIEKQRWKTSSPMTRDSVPRHRKMFNNI